MGERLHQIHQSPRTLNSFEQQLKGKMFGGSGSLSSTKTSSSNVPVPIKEAELKNQDKNKPEEDMITSEEVETCKRIRQYPRNHPGPYTVYIRSHTEAVCHLTVARYLFNTYNAGISTCKEVSQYKLRVECNTVDLANRLPFDKKLSKFRVYVPASEVECEGVINFSQNYDVNELLSDECYGLNLEKDSKINILETFRMNTKRIEENSKEKSFIPSKLIRVTFEGKLLPNYVVINCLRIPVRPFIKNPMFCTNCNEYKGHTSKFCNKKLSCFKCGNQHATKDCESSESTVTCPTCKTEHTNDLEHCPKYKKVTENKQAKIRAAAKYAQRQLRQVTQVHNSFDVLNEEEFPTFESTTVEYKNPSKSNTKCKPTSWAETVCGKKDNTKSAKKQASIPGFKKVEDPLISRIVNWIDKWPISNDWKDVITQAILPLLLKISPIIAPLINLISPDTQYDV